MTKENSLTLAGANQAIHRYLHGFRFREIPAEERAFLASIQEGIFNIYQVQRNWKVREHDGVITQQDLIEEAGDAQWETSQQIKIAVDELLERIKQQKNTAAAGRYTDLLTNLENCINSVATTVNKDIALMNVGGNYQLFTYHEDVALIESLGGRYVPFSQSLDPLRGTDPSGKCNGYTKVWCNEIQKNGLASLSPRLNDDVLKGQEDDTFFDFLKNLFWLDTIDHLTD